MNSLVRNVGMIHPKNLEWDEECTSGECAGVGEKSIRSLNQLRMRGKQ